MIIDYVTELVNPVQRRATDTRSQSGSVSSVTELFLQKNMNKQRGLQNTIVKDALG